MKTYAEFIKSAKENGVATEKAMWKGVDSVDELLCMVAEEHPELYEQFMRKQHQAMYGCHYDKHFAEMDVEGLKFTAPSGEKRSGAHWSADQVQDATKGMSFPSGTTAWDKYVAFNSFYADLCTVLDEALILKAAHKFYFADEDAPAGKIWHYMTAMHYKES